MDKIGNDVKIEKSHDFHIGFILFSHFGARDPGLGPKAAARSPARAWPTAALGPGPGLRAPKCENNLKIIRKTHENNVICQVHIIFHILFILFSYFSHISGLGTQIQTPTVIFVSYSWSYLFILFSYFCENLVFRLVHTDNLYNSCKEWKCALCPPTVAIFRQTFEVVALRWSAMVVNIITTVTN